MHLIIVSGAATLRSGRDPREITWKHKKYRT